MKLGSFTSKSRSDGKVACENIRFSSLFAAGDVSREGTSPVAKSEEKRMFSQANGKETYKKAWSRAKLLFSRNMNLLRFWRSLAVTVVVAKAS